MIEHRPQSALSSLHEHNVEFIIVGGTAAVLLGVALVTEDVDIVHRRTDDNVDRLLAWLLQHDAFHRFDLAGRRLPPTKEALLGTGHLNLQTTLGKVDVLCELGAGEGYEELLADTVVLDGPIPLRVLDLPRLIRVKAATGRAKDRIAIPLLVAALDERRSRS